MILHKEEKTFKFYMDEINNDLLQILIILNYMVLSKINDKITYNESKKIDENDKGRDVTCIKLIYLELDIML